MQFYKPLPKRAYSFQEIAVMSITDFARIINLLKTNSLLYDRGLLRNFSDYDILLEIVLHRVLKDFS
jgi:hypothetical protein